MSVQAASITPFNNPLIRFLAEPKFRWLRHTVFFIIALILGFKGDVGAINDMRSPEQIRAFLVVDVFTFIGIMSMMYLLLLFLIPRLLFRGKIFQFAICFLVLISAIYVLVWYVDYVYLLAVEIDPAHPKMQHVELSILAYIQYCAISAVLLGSVVGIAIFKKWVNDVQSMNELLQTNLRTELEQLKSQVNPHFLFNTLNNLYVLARTDAVKASQVILGLSDLLRYQLYDSAKDQILLSKDIDFIHNLLALEKIRKDNFEYSIKTEGKVDGVALPPFLFIPFIENAIKHGSSTIGHSYLTVHFHIEKERLHFQSVNSKPFVKNNLIGGLGMKNITRRLELLFPGTYELTIDNHSDKYIVNLILPL